VAYQVEINMRKPGSWRLKALGYSFLVAALAVNCNNTGSANNKQAGADSSNTAETAAVAPADTAAPAQVATPAVQPIVIDSNKRYIFITWDDGPQPPGTSNCFNTFKSLGIKATFFMVADHADSKERHALVDSIRSSYPQYLLANHSKSHAFSDHYQYFYHHPEEAAPDFFAAQQKLNVRYKIARLPGNSAWVRQGEVKASPLVKPVCLLLDSAGYNVIGWDEEWGFKTHDGYSFPVQSAETMARMIDNDFTQHRTHTRNCLVWLAHDRMFGRKNYEDSLYKCLSILKKDPRYVFETIDHYPGIKQNN
jgi:peptidoglycan/xylan/chitin deacetylase (PgdA/CDA1 family)